MGSILVIAAMLLTTGPAVASWGGRWIARSSMTSGRPAASPAVACKGVMKVIATSENGPLSPGGGSRLKDLDYFVPFTGYNDDGKQAAFGSVTHDLFCGPYPPEPETIASSSSVNLAGPHAGLEPDQETFVIVLSDDGKTYILERRSNATYTTPTLFHTGYTAISMQRIADSLDRLTISVKLYKGAIATQTVRTADSSTWGDFLSTPFSASFGVTGKTRRATAAGTGDPDHKSEIAMTWAYDSKGTGYRVIRYALNPNFRTNDNWSAAKTLVSMRGKDLTDPRISRWGDETRVYFMERDIEGNVSIDYVVSTDYARTWSSVQRIHIPRPVSEGLTKLTSAMVGKSRDVTNPIGVIGGYDPISGLYELVAFVAPP
jgi:hypothetical protein